jgi:hypothetical protein
MMRTTPDQATLFRTVTYVLALWGSYGRDAASRLASLRDQPNVRGVGAWERGRWTRGRRCRSPSSSTRTWADAWRRGRSIIKRTAGSFTPPFSPTRARDGALGGLPGAGYGVVRYRGRSWRGA